MFKLEIDLSEVMALGEAEAQELKETLDKISGTNPGAKEIIDRARSDYRVNPFMESVELDPALDKTLEDILRNAPDNPEDL